MVTTAEALQSLRDDPESFLKTNCIIIAGGATRNPGPTIFRMLEGDTDVRSAGSVRFWKKKARTFWSVRISNNNGGDPGPGVVLADDEFEAYYIPMKQVGDTVMHTFGQVPTDGSQTIVLTSQLTGCTFGYSAVNGHFFAAHLQPPRDAGMTQVVKQRTMADRIQAGMGGTGKLIRKGEEYRDIATVLGL